MLPVSLKLMSSFCLHVGEKHSFKNEMRCEKQKLFCCVNIELKYDLMEN